MRNKILITIYILIIGAVIYFAYPVIKNRYFQPANETSSEEENKSSKNKGQNGSDSANEEDYENDLNDAENGADEAIVPDDVFIEIDQEDCEENCEQFEDEEDKKYCQKYCGINGDSTPADTSDCDSLKDLEKDYCWKDKAIAEKNFSFCKKIADKKIQESCKTRLTEEVINGSNSPIE